MYISIFNYGSKHVRKNHPMQFPHTNDDKFLSLKKIDDAAVYYFCFFSRRFSSDIQLTSSESIDTVYGVNNSLFNLT